MRKLIIKTALITLCSVLGAIILFCALSTLFFPKTLGGVFEATGCYSASTWFYERQYNVSGNEVDLFVLVEKLDETNDSVRTEKYSVKLVSDSQVLDSFVNGYGKTSFGTESRAKEYVYRKAVISSINSGKTAEALTYCNAFVVENGYTQYNPYRAIISELGTSLTAENLILIKNSLTELKQTISSASLDSDIAIIDSYLS